MVSEADSFSDSDSLTDSVSDSDSLSFLLLSSACAASSCAGFSSVSVLAVCVSFKSTGSTIVLGNSAASPTARVSAGKTACPPVAVFPTAAGRAFDTEAVVSEVPAASSTLATPIPLAMAASVCCSWMWLSTCASIEDSPTLVIPDSISAEVKSEDSCAACTVCSAFSL